MIVYHGTTRRRAMRIGKEGFLPKKPSRRVWFAQGRGYALGRAKTQARRAHGRPAVLKCEIDLGTVLSDATIRKDYRVIDPIATGLLRPQLSQGDKQNDWPRRSATMKTAQPVKCVARWDKARLEVGGVEFVIRPKGDPK